MLKRNYANFILRCRRKFVRKFQELFFDYIKKPIYTFSYNSGSNVFICKGTLRNCKIHVSGNGHKIVIERGTEMNDVLIEISGNDHSLFIGRNVRFGHGGRIRIDDKNNVVELLEGSNFVNVFFSISDDNNKILVGENCLFSAQVIIRASDGHSILDSNEQRCNYGSPVLIGNRVWIGYGVTVLKGTTIGDDSIVGTESLLSGKVYPNNSVIVGNPGKVVKQGCHWCYDRV